MTIREVSSVKDRSEFLLLPLKIYKDDPMWIRPLDKDIEGVFDPKKNKFFRHGKCTRFLLENGKGDAIGRIAVFINGAPLKKRSNPPAASASSNASTTNRQRTCCLKPLSVGFPTEAWKRWMVR
jgi:hypothetical protein